MKSGLILINKPLDITSFDCVNIVKNSIGIKSGHVGTLDPKATGVMPIVFGNALKLSKYLVTHDKTYIATIKLGQTSNTLDLEGEIVRDENIDKIDLSKEKIINVLKTFIGKQMQIPPKYSSIKVNGKKLYEYARSGIEVELKKREVEIYYIKILELDTQNLELTIELEVSKGTYIRALARDIANKLGTVGMLTKLIRTKVDNYTLDNCLDISQFLILNGPYRAKNNLNYDEQKDEINEKKEMLKKEIKGNFLCEKQILMDIKFNKKLNEKEIILDDENIFKFLNGNLINIKIYDGNYLVLDKKGEIIGIGNVKNTLLKRDFVIDA